MAVSVPILVVCSLLLAVPLQKGIQGGRWFKSGLLIPMAVPVASVVLLWQCIFAKQGFLNGFLDLFGIPGTDWMNTEYAFGVLVFSYVWKNLGYNMILFMAALNNIPKELLEVADVEGASAAHKFFNIKLRYLSPTVLFVAILSIINSFKVFREIYLLTGNYPFDGLYMMQHFMNNTFSNLDYQKMSSAAVLMALVMVALIALLFKVEDIFGKDVEG